MRVKLVKLYLCGENWNGRVFAVNIERCVVNWIDQSWKSAQLSVFIIAGKTMIASALNVQCYNVKCTSWWSWNVNDSVRKN